MSQVKLRPATPSDAVMLQRWQKAEHVQAGLPDLDWDWPEQLREVPDWIEYFIAEYDGKPVGFLELLDPKLETWDYWKVSETGLRALDIWIGEAEYLGRGIGTQMMHQAIDHCFSNPDVKAIILDVLLHNEGAMRLYERIGFKYTHNEVLDGEECRIYRLNRDE